MPQTYAARMPADDPDHSFNDPRARSESYQRVDNQAWPKDVEKIRDQEAADQVPVKVRIVFRDDGETMLDGLAIRWSADFRHICVQVNDPRLQTGLVWVRREDTQPRV